MCWLLGLFYILMMLLYLFIFIFLFFCLATQPSVVCFLLQEDELSGVSSALWLHADSAALGCHLLSLMHLLFESEGAVVLMPEGFVWEFLL